MAFSKRPGRSGSASWPRRGHLVVRVSSAKAADLRRFLSRHAKTNGINAQTLARLPLVAPDSLEPVELPGAARATLDRGVRAVARLTERIGGHKPGSGRWRRRCSPPLGRPRAAR